MDGVSRPVIYYAIKFVQTSHFLKILKRNFFLIYFLKIRKWGGQEQYGNIRYKREIGPTNFLLDI